MPDQADEFECVPQALKDIDRWILWRWARRVRKGKPSEPVKVPTRPTGDGNISAHDPSAWMSFDDAREAFRIARVNNTWGGGGGIGFVFTDADDLGGVDLDGCRDPKDGRLARWAQECIDRFQPTYVEASVSGTGVHIYARGAPKTLAKTERKVTPAEDDPVIKGKAPHVEAYVSGRFFTVSGNHIAGPTQIGACPEAWAQLAEYIGGGGHEWTAGAQAQSLDIESPSRAYDDADLAAVESALGAFTSDDVDRNTFVEIGHVLKHTFGEEACSVWLEWMAKSPNDDPNESEGIWEGLKGAPRSMTLGTIFHHARQHGWSFPHDQYDPADDFENAPSLDDEAAAPEDIARKHADWVANWIDIGQRDIATLPRTPWLTKDFLLYNDIALVSGPGGVGKSIHAWQVGVHVAQGMPFGWWEAPERPRRVLVLSGEDDLDEIERRVAVACKLAGVERASLGDRFKVRNSRNIRLVRRDMQSGKITKLPLYDEIHWMVRQFDIGLLIIDPLIKVSSGFVESSNDDMEELFDIIRNLTTGVQCAVLIDDHNNKSGGTDRNANRGASAKIDAARFSGNLLQMTDKEADDIKPPQPPESYVRFVGTKANYGKRIGSMWMELVEYEVGNGETRVALRPRSIAELKAASAPDPETWEHSDAFLQMVASGRQHPHAQWPWVAYPKAKREDRLDAAMADKFGMTLEDAREHIEEFERRGIIWRDRWKSPTRNTIEVWRRYVAETTGLTEAELWAFGDTGNDRTAEGDIFTVAENRDCEAARGKTDRLERGRQNGGVLR